MTSVRHRFALAAAAAGAAGALMGVWALARVDGDRGSASPGAGEVGVVVAAVVLAALASFVLTRYALGVVADGAAIAAIVTFAVVGLFGGSATFYLPYFAALLGGCAVAAGEPLPPPDPDDDRMSRPMPRDDGW